MIIFASFLIMLPSFHVLSSCPHQPKCRSVGVVRLRRMGQRQDSRCTLPRRGLGCGGLRRATSMMFRSRRIVGVWPLAASRIRAWVSRSFASARVRVAVMSAAPTMPVFFAAPPIHISHGVEAPALPPSLELGARRCSRILGLRGCGVSRVFSRPPASPVTPINRVFCFASRGEKTRRTPQPRRFVVRGGLLGVLTCVVTMAWTLDGVSGDLGVSVWLSLD